MFTNNFFKKIFPLDGVFYELSVHPVHTECQPACCTPASLPTAAFLNATKRFLVHIADYCRLCDTVDHTVGDSVG